MTTQSTTPHTKWRSRLRPQDLVATGTLGLRSRPGRTILTAIGIAIGIASMVAVLGISSSSKADLLAEIDDLGTNLLQVRPGQSVFGDSAELPVDAEALLSRVATVTEAAAVTDLDTTVQRNPYDDTPNGLAVLAADQNLAETLEVSTSSGRYLVPHNPSLPTVVLGSVAAQRLGITSLDSGPEVTIAGRQFQVIGIAEPLPLNPDIDRSVIIGDTAAQQILGVDPNPTSIYLRVRPEQLEQTRPLLARTANPASPNEVEVSRPSDALEARAAVDKNLQNLLLALGGVALLVGGVGIANVMVISVLERRGEIGVRRAIGATRGHIRAQFVIEAATLATMGGVLGAALGVAITWAYAQRQGWTIDIPIEGLVAGVAAALAIGAAAGLYPAAKAARLDPAEAVRPHN
ncbi:MAG: ABC transporter permease [Acidimicrobiales bacterium]